MLHSKGSVNVSSSNNNTDSKLELCYCYVDDDNDDVFWKIFFLWEFFMKMLDFIYSNTFLGGLFSH